MQSTLHGIMKLVRIAVFPNLCTSTPSTHRRESRTEQKLLY